MSRPSSFDAGRRRWLSGLDNLRNVVRQEMVTRQLAAHLPSPPARVLDVGAGQGTQALQLARSGYDVTAVEPDATMRDVLAAAVDSGPFRVGGRVQVLGGRLGALPAAVTRTAYEVVVCHGVLMYLPDSGAAVAELSARLVPGGVLSLLARNAAAMAWRPAARGRWDDALTMLEEVETAQRDGRDARYTNEIGVVARGDRIDDLQRACEDAGLRVEAWYGVRVATDGAPSQAPVPGDGQELAAIFAVEERMGRTDPYRSLAALTHLVARRPGDRPSPHTTSGWGRGGG